jgi:cell wall-associated protease
MKKTTFKLCFSLLTFSLIGNLHAQENKDVLNWYNQGGAGMQTEKAYKKLEGRKSTTIIVAVIDSGIDIEHEDLKEKIWVNTKEIPDNGIDDDNNGYIDDIHGWNFIGNSNGEHVNQANLEKTRILRELSKKYKDVKESSLNANDKAEYKLYQKVKLEVETELTKNANELKELEAFIAEVEKTPGVVANILKKENYTMEDLKAWKPATDKDIRTKRMAMGILMGFYSTEALNDYKKHYSDMVDYCLNVNFDERALIGDNPNDFSDNKYGNNDVEGPDAFHGTHVAGIIGAVRGNGIGADGVAENVQIMVLRTVPNGDEHDKDIALSIRYAVDNGAKVINMSFGKSYSPNQKEVYEAFAYADSMGVLCVHAAGNDSKNVDVEPNFPSSMYSFQKEKLDLFITVGSSTRNTKDFNDAKFFEALFSKEKKRNNKKHLPSEFSNYGQKTVDIFAPGSEIYNSVPQSEYATIQGTSMACPMVAGVAAMLASYFPTLTMEEITAIMLKSAKSYKGKKHVKPGEDVLVDFSTLSVTGGVINVSNAVDMCLELEKQKGN